MYKLKSEGMELLLRYNDFYGDKVERPNLQEEIKKLNMNKAISIICELIAVRNKKIKVDFELLHGDMQFPFETSLKVMLLKLKPEDMNAPILQSNIHIISLQMLLNLLKYVIVYGDKDTINDSKYEITFEDYKKIIDLQLLVTESYDKQFEEFCEKDKAHFIYANYHVNNKKNDANAVARAYYMFEKVLKNPECLDDDVKNEYKDYGGEFDKKYGYTIFDYISFAFSELTPYFEDGRLYHSSMWRNINVVYKSTKFFECSKKVMNDLSIMPLDLVEWATEAKSNMWDFSKFYSAPFFNVSNQYISISDFTLDNALFENLFWRIRECFPAEEKQCMAFYGRLFEKYVQTLIESSAEKNKKYSYIPEFICKSGNKSSDAYLQAGTDLIIIECKGFSILINTLLAGQQISQNNNKLFVDPVLQADNRFDEIVKNDKKFLDINRTFIISVTMDNINAVPLYYEEIFKEVERNKKSKITKYIYNFSIEEYELLIYLVEKKDNVIQILEEYYSQKTIEPFKSYLFRNFPSEEMYSECVDTIFKEAGDKIKDRLFGKEK